MDSNNNAEGQGAPIGGIQLHENEYDQSIHLDQASVDESNNEDQTNNTKSVIKLELGSRTTDDLLHTSNNQFIKVRERESTDSEEIEAIEIELEDDRSLLLSSLTSLFPEATGLTFRHPETNSLRGVKLVDGKLVEPVGGWDFVPEYVCVLSKNITGKRKAQDDGATKRPRIEESNETTEEGIELIVLGLQYGTSEATTKEYFEQFGEVLEVEIKKDRKSGKSKGFGFVRFSDPDVEEKLTSKRHCIDGRWCDVKVPLTKAEAESTKAAQLSRKIFVGRLPNDITENDLREHFTTYGTLTDVYIPKPFRNFAFVTFETSVMAKSIYGVEHNIKGATVQISEAIPRDSFGGQNNNNYNNNNNINNNNNSNNNNTFSKGFNMNHMNNNSINNNNAYRQNQYKSHQHQYSPQQPTYPPVGGNYNNYGYNHNITNPGYNNSYSSSYNQPYSPNNTTHHYRMHQTPQASHHQHNPPQAMAPFHNQGFTRGNSYQVWKQ